MLTRNESRALYNVLCIRKGIAITLHADGRVTYKSPTPVCPVLLALMKRHKLELIDYMTVPPEDNETCYKGHRAPWHFNGFAWVCKACHDGVLKPRVFVPIFGDMDFVKRSKSS